MGHCFLMRIDRKKYFQVDNPKSYPHIQKSDKGQKPFMIDSTPQGPGVEGEAGRWAILPLPLPIRACHWCGEVQPPLGWRWQLVGICAWWGYLYHDCGQGKDASGVRRSTHLRWRWGLGWLWDGKGPGLTGPCGKQSLRNLPENRSCVYRAIFGRE